VRVGAVGDPGQRQRDHPEQLTPRVQRRRQHRGEARLVGGGHRLLAGGRVEVGLQVGHHDRLQARHGLLHEVARRVLNRLAHLRPGAGRRLPAAGVRGHPPDQLVPAEQVDEAVVGEPGHQDLRDLPEGRVELERARQPGADPLEQPDPVRLALGVPPPGLADQHDHAADGAGRVAQRHRVLPHEHQGPVAPAGGQRVFPRHPAQHLAGKLVGLALVVDEPGGRERPPGQRRRITGQPQQPDNVFVCELYVAVGVRDDDADLRLAQNKLGRQIFGGGTLVPARHRHAPVKAEVCWLLPGHEHV
jgi:hypothetical protein